MHEIRKDPLLSRWVIVLENSLHPSDYPISPATQKDSDCLICRQDIIKTASVDAKDGPVISIENPSPLLFKEGPLGRRGVGIYDTMNSIGLNEIIIESEHGQRPEDFGADRMRAVLELLHMRVSEMSKDDRVVQVVAFKNPTNHPHIQVMASPVIPLRIKSELDGAKQYYSYKERCVFCDIMDEELKRGERVVANSERFIAFCPFASRFAFETWIMPKRHVCDFNAITHDEISDLGMLITDVLGRMRRVLKDAPYAYVLHTAPHRIPKRNHWHTLGDDYHWHIEITPRLYTPSGFEFGFGMYVLSTSPEHAAKYLKEG